MRLLDEKRLLEFLNQKAKERDVTKTSGLVIASVYEGLVTRIRSGEFDVKEK
jgi:pantoate kinase